MQKKATVKHEEEATANYYKVIRVGLICFTAMVVACNGSEALDRYSHAQIVVASAQVAAAHAHVLIALAQQEAYCGHSVAPWDLQEHQRLTLEY